MARNRLTNDDVDAYFEELARYGTLRSACKSAQIDPRDIQRQRRTDSTFADREALAMELYFGKLLEENYRRAVEGDEVPLMHRGKPVYQTDPKTGKTLKDAFGQPLQAFTRRRSDKLLADITKMFHDKLPLSKAEESRIPPALKVEFTDSDGNGRLPRGIK